MSELPTDYQAFIHASRYARFRDDLGRREHWSETVDRYFDYFEQDLDERHSYKVSPTLRSELRDAVFGLHVMPSMRALMTAGEAAKRENIAVYNCAYLPIDRPKAFAEALYILMCGTGVGFSVERQVISKLPEVPASFSQAATEIVVGDSKLGWAEAFNALILHLYGGTIPKIDVSNVRAAGERLKVFGGRASGPAPFVSLCEFTIKTFRNAAGRRLNSLEVHELVTKTGEIVVVGGVRRSAEISLSNLSDQRMRNAKSGNWWADKPHLALANNSVAYTEKPDVGAFMDEWSSLYRSKSGERGIFNRQGAVQKILRQGRRDHRFEFGTNPCVTGDTLIGDRNEPIQSRVGKPTMVWNSERWIEVVPYSTGVNPIVQVILNTGVIISCTPYHGFYVDGIEGKVEAKDLVAFDRLAKLTMPDGSKQKVVVISVMETGVEQETFCYTDPEHSVGMFDGVLTAQCGEILLRPRGLCNLTEAVIRETDNTSAIHEKLRLASILGTWQSTQTSFNFVDPEWAINCNEERLLGVSMTGIYDHGLMRGDNGHDVLASALSSMKQTAIRANRIEAHEIGINPSVAVSTVKPSGTVSSLVNTPSGIHQGHAPYYIRRVTADNKDPITAFMSDAGIPHEPHAAKPQDMTVFSFPVALGERTKTRDQVTAIEHMELVKTYNEHWSEHAVSCTISVKENEWPAVGGWVYDNFDGLSGMSFLPHFEGDSTYSQMPYETITKAEYDRRLADMPTAINWNDMAFYEGGVDSVTGTREFACVGNMCEIVDAANAV